MELNPQDPLYKYQPITKVDGSETMLDDLKTTQDSLKQKAEIEIGKQSSFLSNYYDNTQSSVFTPFLDNRIKTKDYVIDQKEVYKPIGSEMVAMYPNYIQGTDNNERLAQTQSTWDKWQNGLTKASANFLTTVVGNTVGLVYGAANGAKEGSWNAVFDNSFSNALADWNEKLSYQLPNYYTKQEQGEGFFGSLNNANFWANDVAGGLSFTLGTIISEAIWATTTGGTANITNAGLRGIRAANKIRFSKEALGAENVITALADWKKFINSGVRKMFNAPVQTTNAQTYAKWFHTSRFLATTSGNEAGIEALHYKREMRENFYNHFEDLNGRQPSPEEVSEFEENLNNSANAVFAANMAILAPSNAVMFGSLFNIGKPFRGMTKSIDKTIFGVGVEKTAEGVYKGVQATSKQKAARIAYSALKPIATESLWEEGLQGVSTKTAENWITSTFDPKYNNETLSLSDATYKAFAEQYGTKEGWKEMGIGAIIGGGTSLVIGRGLPQELREFQKQEDYQNKYVASGLNQFGDNSTAATDILARKFMLDARVKSAATRQIDAIKRGDDVSAMLAQQEPLIAEIQFRKSIGEDVNELITKYETALNALPQEAWDESGIEDIDGYKQTVLDSYKNLIKSHDRASKFADAVFGDSRILGQNIDTQLLKDALTYSIISGETANKAMDSILSDMSQIIGEDTVKVKQIQSELQKAGKNKQSQVTRLNKTITQAENEIKALSDELQRLQLSKDETKGERLQKTQAKLVEANDRMGTLTQEREALAQELSQEISRRRGIENTTLDSNLTSDFITGDDLANIDAKLKKINDTIKGYQGINHQLYYDLIDLQEQYNSAKSNYFSYQNAVDAIVSGQFAPKFARVNGMLGKVFGQKEEITDFTQEFLNDIYGRYEKAIGKSAVETLTEDQYISDEEYDNFIQTGSISNEIKLKISEKVKAKTYLSERERAIYNTLTDEINNLTQAPINPNKPDLTRTETVEVLTPAQKLRKDLSDAMKKDYPLITVDVDELISGKPSQEDVDRYLEMYPNQARFDLFEQKEFDELQPRMRKWFMAQSLPSVEGMSVADVAELISQLETQIAADETVTEVSAEDILFSAEDKNARDLSNVSILQNMSGSAVAKIKRDKNDPKKVDIYFAQINVKSLLDKLIQNETNIATIRTVDKDGKLKPAKDLTPALLNKNANVKGTQFTIGDIKVTIGDRGNIVMDMDSYNKAKDTINLYYHDSETGKWSWGDVYERGADGLKRKKASEYNTNTNSDAIYNVQEGEDLKLFVDMNTDWNLGLIDEALSEVAENDTLSEETKNKIRNTLEITSQKDRVNNSTAKASDTDTVNDRFMLLRKRFADKFITLMETESLTTLPKTIDLDVEVPVSDIFLGTPEFVLDENDQPIEHDITERGVERIITQGYVKGDEMVLANKKTDTEKVSRLFVSNLAKKSPNSSIMSCWTI